jgi:hypothetical protein
MKERSEESTYSSTQVNRYRALNVRTLASLPLSLQTKDLGARRKDTAESTCIDQCGESDVLRHMSNGGMSASLRTHLTPSSRKTRKSGHTMHQKMQAKRSLTTDVQTVASLHSYVPINDRRASRRQKAEKRNIDRCKHSNVVPRLYEQ